MANPATAPAKSLSPLLLMLTIGLGLAAISSTGCKQQSPDPKPADTRTSDAGETPPSTPSIFDESVFDEPAEIDPQAMVGLSWDEPEGWERYTDTKSARLDTWKIPGASEQVTVYAFSFGKKMAQTPEYHADRWSSQFIDDEGNRPEPEIESWEGDGVKVTIITFTEQRMAGLALDELQLGSGGARMVGAVVEGSPFGVVLFRLSGPTAEVETHTPAFLDLMRSVELHENAQAP